MVVVKLAGVGVVTEPCDPVPMGASEIVDNSIEEGMSPPPET